LLTVAYMLRDRETKLRLYPGIAPIIILPVILMVQGGRHQSTGSPGFLLPFIGCYMGMLPMLALQILRFSQQWQAADVFQLAPMPGPASICHGARRAVFLILVVPIVVVMLGLSWFAASDVQSLLLLLPGLTLLPVYSLIPAWLGKGVPLCQPIDSAKAANRGATMMIITVFAFVLAGLTAFAKTENYFWTLELVVLGLSILAYFWLQSRIRQQRWPSAE
jgi:hypothetical protein